MTKNMASGNSWQEQTHRHLSSAESVANKIFITMTLGRIWWRRKAGNGKDGQKEREVRGKGRSEKSHGGGGQATSLHLQSSAKLRRVNGTFRKSEPGRKVHHLGADGKVQSPAVRRRQQSQARNFVHLGASTFAWLCVRRRPGVNLVKSFPTQNARGRECLPKRKAQYNWPPH